MSIRNLIPFLILVFAVALGGTFLAIQLFSGDDGAGAGNPSVQLVTVEVIVTATPNPNATVPVVIITATPDREVAQIPDSVLPQTAPDNATDGTTDNALDGLTVIAPTIDPTVLGANEAIGLTATALPTNCLLHVIEEGDTPFGVAELYGANGFLLLEVNGLTEETAGLLQIGQTVVVPLEGCNYNLPPTATPTLDPDVATPIPEITDEADDTTPTPAFTPTITLAPTSVNASVSIVTVDNIGDVTAEGVRIRNSGNTVDITGWSLNDTDGNTYEFTEQFLFSNAEVTVYTRAGTDSPIARFWGLDEPVWQGGDVVTLSDADGQVQATIRIESAIDLE